MEQLQSVNVLVDLDDGAVEGQRVVDQVLKAVEVYIIAKEGTGNIVGDILKAHRGHVIEECLWQAVYLLRHVKSAVFGQSLDDGLAQIGIGSLMVCTVVFHLFLAILAQRYE